MRKVDKKIIKKKLQKEKVMLGIATGPFVVAKFAFSLVDLAVHPSDKYECAGIISYAGVMVDDSRNKIVEDFLRTPCEWLMMLDTDVVFQSNIIELLLEMHKKLGTKAGCGWYNILNEEGGVRPALFRYSEDKKTSKSPIMDSRAPQYFETDLGPSGAMLIHREVFEKIKATGEAYYFKFQHKGAGNTVSEDVYFCDLIKKLGYKFVVCSAARMLHYKLLPI